MVVGGFVGFVDDDEAKVVNWGEKGGARTDNDMRFSGSEELFPDKVAFGFGLAGVDENNMATKGGVENGDELGSEGYFWDEKDSGLTAGKGRIGQF